MAIVLAALAALGWGTSDYLGGRVTGRGASVFVVVATGEALGLVIVAPVLLLHGAPPGDPRLLWAAAAGLSVTAELALIYRALSDGLALITAPVGALGAAIAVGAGLASGDPLSLAVAAGLVTALAGSAIATWPPRGGTPPAAAGALPRSAVRVAAIALAAAAAVAITLGCLHAGARADSVWAAAIAHASTAVSAGALAALRDRGRRRSRARRVSPALALNAAAGIGGDLAYAAASHTGALSLVAAVASLYPVATIAYGRLLDGHRASVRQGLGAGLALAGGALLGAAAP